MLRPIKNVFKAEEYPDLLVGMDSPDDAAVWKLDENRAIVITTDFFTPVVDDPYHFGSIAAANSLSDVYAMGGMPFLALNVAALPPDLPAEYTSEIIRGGAEKAREAGVVIAGGHTVQDTEPKYGLVAVGFVDVEHLLTKKGAKPGDLLVLTKPLGFGVTTTALKRQIAELVDVAEVTAWMERLNQQAGKLAREFNLRSTTDVTGYSLLGHGLEMANASHVAFRIHFNQLPFTQSARKYAELGAFPGGAHDNRHYFSGQVQLPPDLDEPNQMLLFDPQTSGGLLMAVPPKSLDGLMARAQEIAQPAWVIGSVIEGQGIEVV